MLRDKEAATEACGIISLWVSSFRPEVALASFRCTKVPGWHDSGLQLPLLSITESTWEGEIDQESPLRDIDT